MTLPAHIPPLIWTMAKQSGQRNGDHASTLRTAEMLLKRSQGKDGRDEDVVVFWPGLTRRGTRTVRDALFEHETVIDEDVSELFRLRSVFDNQCPSSGQSDGRVER